jgi:hypothetical protein
VLVSCGLHSAALGSSDEVLRDGEVDDPAGAEQEGPAEFAGAEYRLSDALGEGLGAGAEGERVSPGHPGLVMGDVSAPERGEAEDDAGGHAGPEREPEKVGQLAGAATPWRIETNRELHR